MRVVEVTAYGGPEVLRPAERPEPVPAAGEVVVRIHAAAINPTDLTTRRAPRANLPDLKPPFVPGWDLAGVVTVLGEGVTDFRPGDRVVGMIPFGRIGGRVGAYAEAAAVDPSWLVPLAAHVSFEMAATVPLNALTADQALAFFALPAGARLLVTGASGGVGGFATQLAVRAGLHVIGVAGRDDEPWVAGLGAAEVLSRDADLGVLAPVDGVLDAAALGPPRATLPLREGGTAVFVRASDPPTSDRYRFEHVTV